MNAELYELYSEFLTWFGDLYYATEPPKCKAKQLKDMEAVIDVGQIICRGYNYYLDSHFIPGDYTHSGIVIAKDKMVHSIAEGVDYVDPVDFIKDTDRFIILQPIYNMQNEVRKAQIESVVKEAIWHVEHQTEYDFTFKDETKLYCHEFSVKCVEKAGIIVNKTHMVFGVWPFKFERDLYLAQNLIDVCSVVYEFKGGEDND